MRRIPFTISSIDKLKKRSSLFIKLIKPKKTKLSEYLKNGDFNISREEYLGICYRNFIKIFFVYFTVIFIILYIINSQNRIIFPLVSSLAISIFVFYSQYSYPKLFNQRKQKEIEKNLIPALQDMLVQLNSGIPLFNILINISESNYGELSKEFKKAVKKINAGYPAAEVLEDLGDNNSSIFFRRTLWQISNGMKAGSDISIVIKESIKSLNEEQLIQIQNYGNKLNPIIMFYMLITVIMPALAITFITVITSMIKLPQNTNIFIFSILLLLVVFIQIFFLGVIKSIKPTLI